MSTNTSKPTTRTKRSKRVVEVDKFDAFVRRILAAYARRVATGDIEALRSLAALSSEVDAVTRLAVAGLRKAPYSYSWQEIADRLGTSRQAAQMRYGDRTGRGTLDRRLVEAGLTVTVATLVEVFADHYPGSPAPSVCPGCGYRYPESVTECPTMATVRPILYRRRAENGQAVARLTPDQTDYLHGKGPARRSGTGRRGPHPTTPPEQGPASLFPISINPGGDS